MVFGAEEVETVVVPLDVEVSIVGSGVRGFEVIEPGTVGPTVNFVRVWVSDSLQTRSLTVRQVDKS